MRAWSPCRPRTICSFHSSGCSAAITPRTKVIAVANPNSPSGSAATREQLLELARRAPQAVLLVDEAYFHFHGETVMDLVGKVPNLVVARTFSKAYGLAGLRLGLLAGPSRIDALDAARAFALQRELAGAGVPAARAGGQGLSRLVRGRGAGGARGVRSGARCGRRAPLAEPRKLRSGGDRRDVTRSSRGSMRAAGVLVRDRSSDPGCDGRVRITIGTREQMGHAAWR